MATVLELDVICEGRRREEGREEMGRGEREGEGERERGMGERERVRE